MTFLILTCFEGLLLSLRIVFLGILLVQEWEVLLKATSPWTTRLEASEREKGYVYMLDKKPALVRIKS